MHESGKGAKRTCSRSKALWLATLALCLSNGARAEEPPEPRRLAVLEFHAGDDVPPQVRLLMSDRARAGALTVARPRGIIVMTRESMDVMSKDMGKSDCVAGSCEMEIARNIGANYVMSGEVALLEGGYYVTLKLHETDKGELLATQALRGKNQLEAVDALEAAARELVSKGLASGAVPLAPALAAKRRDTWKVTAAAKARRREPMAKVCAQYAEDSARLQKLLALDEQVVPAPQKAAYKAEFERAYASVGNVDEQCRAAQAKEAEAVRNMVFVPGGSFQMGSNDGDGDEKPVHTVQLSPYYLDKTEVTVAAYKKCVEAGRCGAANTDGACNWGQSGKDNHPINCVDWNQANTYCKWTEKRLPTEAEWEYAARGSDGRKYPWGDEAPGSQLCWNRRKSEGTCEVGSYPNDASPFGVLDMAGNVYEWTSDWYHGYFYGSSQNSSNPTGPTDGIAHVNRGGSWLIDTPSRFRATYRFSGGSSIWYDYLGFRCARTGQK